MERREFLGLVVGAMTLWPLSARGQKAAMPTVGFLSSLSPQELSFVMPAFHRGLGETGFGEGRAIEYRWAEGHFERLPALAADLVGQQVAGSPQIANTIGIMVVAPFAAKAATAACGNSGGGCRRIQPPDGRGRRRRIGSSQGRQKVPG